MDPSQGSLRGADHREGAPGQHPVHGGILRAFSRHWVVDDEQALEEANKQNMDLLQDFSVTKRTRSNSLEEIEAGVTYVNKRSGATTGAWPGAQPFCGWKGSMVAGRVAVVPIT